MRRRLVRFLSLFGPFLGLLFIYGFFLLYDFSRSGALEDFSNLFTSYNLKQVAAQTTIVAVAALGMTVIIVSGGIDLSPGSTIALSSVVAALCLQPGATYPALAVVAAIGTGMLVGFANGALITGFRIVPFIVTLGMMGIARGVAKSLGDEQKINAEPSWLNGLLAVDSTPGAPWWKLPPGVVVLAVLAVAVAVVLRKTVFGRHVFAIGSNESAARLCGVRVGLRKLCIYTLSGALTGVAGVLQFSQLTVGDPTVAAGKELDIIASVVIGGGSLSGGKGGVAGTLIGAFIMGVLRNGCDIFVIPNYVQEIFIGVIIIAAVGLDQLRLRS